MKRRWPSLGIAALFCVQLVCALFFLRDLITSVLGIRTRPLDWAFYEILEIGAALSLVAGTVVTGRLLLASQRRARRAEDSLRLAQSAFADVLHERFDDWGLTPAERDVALFTIKGLTIAQIAELRNTSEGTVKAQGNAIYRKAGVSNRAQLVSVFIEDLMNDDPVPLPSSRKAG